jgi:hypothetical protein
MISSFLLYTKIQLNRYESEAEKQRNRIQFLYGVDVHYKYTQKSFFPHDWKAEGSQAWPQNVTSTLILVEEFLSKYLDEVIKRNWLNYFCSGLLKFKEKAMAEPTLVRPSMFRPVDSQAIAIRICLV